MGAGVYTAIVRGSAFHYPLKYNCSRTFHVGYLKANITSLVDNDSERRQSNIRHPSYPVLYIPFTIVDRIPLLGTAVPWQIEETTLYNGKKKTWRSSYPHPPQRHKGLLDAILAKLDQRLEEIVQNTAPVSLSQRPGRAFLSNFPASLWEDVPQERIYGTVKPFEYFILKADVLSPRGEQRSSQPTFRRLAFRPTEPLYR